jgi:hypothetical protein
MSLAISLLASVSTTASDIALVTFDGAAARTHGIERAPRTSLPLAALSR